jgi:hypothetical protein
MKYYPNEEERPVKQLFPAKKFMVNWMGQLTLLLTFGVVYPPLAIFNIINLYRNSFFVQLQIGRFVAWAHEHQFYSYVKMINDESGIVCDFLQTSLWIVVPFITSFYSLFIFDIYGDSAGNEIILLLLYSG